VHLLNRPPSENVKRTPICPLLNSYIFHPIAFENVGTINLSAVTLISALGSNISTKSNDLRESIFLFQRLAITFQRFNSVLLRESFFVLSGQVTITAVFRIGF